MAETAPESESAQSGSTPDDDGTTGSSRPIMTRGRRRALMGAMFLMATSAVGPGFITQTATFTWELGAAFAFAILISVLVDIAVQLNVWRVLGVSGLYAQQLGNRLLPGIGWILAAFVFFGGLVFNIGNIAGAGIGLNNLLGLDPRIGGTISVVLVLAIFMVRRAGAALDRVVVGCGAVLILMMIIMAVNSRPPVVEAARQTFVPEQVDFLVITTLIGGTVGGYITYAGAHRLIASGHSGPQNVRQITQSSVLGIIVASIIRFLLFLAILGVVVASPGLIEPDNIAGSAFAASLGELGQRIFGLVFWIAAITSILGATFTSISFITSAETSDRMRNIFTAGFLVVTCVSFLLVGQAPQTLLVLAGSVNGLILPLGLGVILFAAAFRKDLLRGYKYPLWLIIAGALTFILTIYMGYESLEGLAELWQSG